MANQVGIAAAIEKHRPRAQSQQLERTVDAVASRCVELSADHVRVLDGHIEGLGRVIVRRCDADVGERHHVGRVSVRCQNASDNQLVVVPHELYPRCHE